MDLLRIAFRNLLRAKRRNALAGGTMAIGAAAMVLGGGVSDGIARQLTDSLVAVQTGELMLVRRGEDFLRQNSPFDAYSLERIEGGESLAGSLRARAGEFHLRDAVPYLHARGSAIALNRSTPAVIMGIVPPREAELFHTLPPVAGESLSAEGFAYVAEPVARKLRLEVGDPITFVIQTPQGAVNSIDVAVQGVFRKGAPWYDNTFFITLRDAQRLMAWDGAATNIKLRVDGGAARSERARSLVREALGGLSAPGVAVETQREAGRFAYSIVQANEAALAILSFFLFAAASVGIVNSMLMSVHERTREIGTIRALGMRRRAVIRMFVLEGVALGAVAAALGVLMGGALVLHLGARGLEMDTITLAWIAGGDTLRPRLEAASVARAVAAILSVSTLAALYPAWAASRMEPREAIHHI